MCGLCGVVSVTPSCWVGLFTVLSECKLMCGVGWVLCVTFVLLSRYRGLIAVMDLVPPFAVRE
jgi:hypothetical protein